MSRLTIRFALVLASVFLVSGCSTARRDEAARLARHPIHDTRMSNRPEAGYEPTGVWRVRGAQNTVYLAGTSHIIASNAIPFPSTFYAAYADAQVVYVEFDTDLSWWAKMRLVPRILKWFKAHSDDLMAPRGKTLTNYLSAATLADLRRRYGKDFSRERITPSFLLFKSETGLYEAKGGEKASGVEEPFEQLARRDGKPLRQLDDGDEMENAFLAVDQALLGYRRDIAQRGADAVVREAMLGARPEDDGVWRHGDLAAAERVQEEMKKESEALYDMALRARNRRWMGKLEPLLRSNKNALVLVGVAHLPGEDGLLHLLRASGFSVEQLYGVDRPGKETAPSPAVTH